MNFTAEVKSNTTLYLRYPYANVNSNTTEYFFMNYQKKAEFNKCNIMLSDPIKPTSTSTSIAYRHEVAMLAVKVNNIPSGKTINNISFMPYRTDSDGNQNTVLMNNLKYSIDESGDLKKEYSFKEDNSIKNLLIKKSWLKYIFDQQDKEDECVFCILPPSEYLTTDELRPTGIKFTILYTDKTKKSLSLDLTNDKGRDFLQKFSSLKPGKALYIELPGNDPTPQN